MWTKAPAFAISEEQRKVLETWVRAHNTPQSVATRPRIIHPNVTRWLTKHPRDQLHITPTSSSWLNLVERWFRELTQNRLRLGVFRSVPELIASIEERNVSTTLRHSRSEFKVQLIGRSVSGLGLVDPDLGG
jgi:transposase